MRIKALLSLLIIVFGFTNAQDTGISHPKKFNPYHDFRIGIGVKPFEAAYAVENFFYMDIEPYFEDYKLIDFDTKLYNVGARYTTNALFIEYIHQKNKWFGIGGTLTYFSYFNNYYDVDTNNKIGKNTASHLSIYPTMRFSWINKTYFSMYSSLGLGLRMISETDKLNANYSNNFRLSIAGQNTIIGLTFGNTIYGFTDISTFGTQGIMTIGVGYRINRL